MDHAFWKAKAHATGKRQADACYGHYDEALMDAAGEPYRNMSQQGMAAFSFCRSKLAAVITDSSTETSIGLCIGDHVVDGSVHLAEREEVKTKLNEWLAARPGPC